MFHSVMPGTGGSFKPSHWLVLNLVFTNVGLIAKTDMIYTAVAFFLYCPSKLCQLTGVDKHHDSPYKERRLCSNAKLATYFSLTNFSYW